MELVVTCVDVTNQKIILNSWLEYHLMKSVFGIANISQVEMNNESDTISLSTRTTLSI